jgi:hypothetical protein
LIEAVDKQLANYFFGETQKAFAFLVVEHGFAPPQPEVDDQIDTAIVTFMGRNLAVECLFEAREGDVDCKIALIVNGKKTTHYAIDEHGVRVRDGLANLLRRRGVRERLFQPIGEYELSQRITTTLGDFAAMLKKYGQDILNDSPDALAL